MNRPAILLLLTASVAACTPPTPPPPAPTLTPATQPAASFALDRQDIHPMYAHLLSVDLPTVERLALADNLDIEQARLRVDAAKGQYESSVEAIFPIIAPSLAWTHFDGTNQNASGTLVSAAFNDFLPGASVQWILNPGKVVFDMIAARRRLDASQDNAKGADLDTERRAALQYYELVLAQARLSAAREALAESEELERLTAVRLRAGTGLPVDQMRAQSEVARRRQDLTSSLNSFYQLSVALSLILHLDPSITLVPKVDEVEQTTLVRDDLSIGQLLELASTYRPDLRGSRELAAAFHADKNSVIWGGIGPQIQTGYSAGGIQTDNDGHTSALHLQQKANASAGLTLSLSTFGNAKLATANERLADIDIQRLADRIRAAVVLAHQNALTNAALVPLARQQLDSATEALRLAQANLKAGTLLTIDVLQAQDAVEQARLRYVEAVVHYNQSQVDLLAAVGLLDQKTMTMAESTNPPPP